METRVLVIFHPGRYKHPRVKALKPPRDSKNSSNLWVLHGVAVHMGTSLEENFFPIDRNTASGEIHRQGKKLR